MKKVYDTGVAKGCQKTSVSLNLQVMQAPTKPEINATISCSVFYKA